MSARPPELSIIIPAFNEEFRLPVTLAQISGYIRMSGRDTEVIVVDDGSTDRTSDIAESFRDEIARLRVRPRSNHSKLLDGRNARFS